MNDVFFVSSALEPPPVFLFALHFNAQQPLRRKHIFFPH